MARVTPPDLELFLTRHVRRLAAVENVKVRVVDVEPADLDALKLGETFLVVLRDDSGARADLTTFDRSIGATVLGGSKENPGPINTASRWLAAVLMDDAIVEAADSPIASVTYDGFNGPYGVADPSNVARRYITGQYTVVGTW